MKPKHVNKNKSNNLNKTISKQSKPYIKGGNKASIEKGRPSNHAHPTESNTSNTKNVPSKYQQSKAKFNEEREKQIKENKKLRLKKKIMMTAKTRKGQPLMKGRMEMLLEKIQKNLKNE